MDEKKLPSASDLYRDRYQGKLKSMSDKRVRKLLLELPDSSILNYSWGDVYEEIGEYDSWDGPTLKEALHELAVAIEARKKADAEITHMLNLYKRAIVERDQFAKLMGTMKGEHDALEKENKELRASVKEWVCPKCDIVYTESALVGEMGRCPKCDGYVGTRYQVERDVAIGKLFKLNAYVDEAKKAAGDFYITGRPLPEVVEDIMEALYKAEDDLEDERSRVALRDMWLNEAEEEIRELRGKEGNNDQVK